MKEEASLLRKFQSMTYKNTCSHKVATIALRIHSTRFIQNIRNIRCSSLEINGNVYNSADSLEKFHRFSKFLILIAT